MATLLPKSVRILFRTYVGLPDVTREAFLFGQYALHLLKASFFPDQDLPKVPKLELYRRAQVQQIADAAHAALRNPARVNWKLRDLLAAVQEPDFDPDQLWKRFPPLGPHTGKPPGRFSPEWTPEVVVDQEGYILLWYFPSVIRDQYIQQILQTLRSCKEGKSFFSSKDDGTWRRHEGNFYGGDFQTTPQGMALLFPVASRSARGSDSERTYGPSKCFRKRIENAFTAVGQLMDPLALLSAISAVTQPTQFHAGVSVLESFHKGELEIDDADLFTEVLENWAATYHAIAIYNNHNPPLHTEELIPHLFYETFLSCGSSPSTTRFICATHRWLSEPTSDSVVMVGSHYHQLIKYYESKDDDPFNGQTGPFTSPDLLRYLEDNITV
ncbi:hypothetical protein CC1G_11683 [Coprinopsis cinerea okayama7|uniref:Uncharacterized protein n=1 Tax=Coprinopsis cinerea (strain Okayama-7 / 130 / ATCC MYA-4618 / FGSC 9003) TaxID=240176 RepID=A8P3V0_COPC7|nr:hypothetical protein CC1G_11683 [Coprinopsis cinerea okayama7\|eukprot:XP_001838621.2 hypothetical protein CC1G_11683 [Coprinopsis cinerea okayama7\